MTLFWIYSFLFCEVLIYFIKEYPYFMTLSLVNNAKWSARSLVKVWRTMPNLNFGVIPPESVKKNLGGNRSA